MAGRGKCPVLSVKESVLRIRSRLRVFLMKVGNQDVMHMAIVSAPKTDQNRSFLTNNTETGDFPGNVRLELPWRAFFIAKQACFVLVVFPTEPWNAEKRSDIIACICKQICI